MSDSNQLVRKSKRVAISEVYVDVLYSDDDKTKQAIMPERVSTLDLQWPRGNESLLERVDYLTSIFPFELVELRETRPNSSQAGLWTATLKYDGMLKDKARFEENFLALLVPRRSEFIA